MFLASTHTNTGVEKKLNIIKRFLPFWLMVVLFKTAGVTHYEVLPVLGGHFLPLWLVGLVIGGESLIQMFLDVPAGYLLDKMGYLRLIAISTLLFIVSAACFLINAGVGMFIATVFLSTFGWLFFDPGINAYALTQATPGTGGKFMALRDSFSSLGAVIASAFLPLTLLLPIPHIGFILILIFLLALLLLTHAPPDRSVSVHERKIESHGFYIRRHLIGETMSALKRLNPASTTLLLTGFSASIFYGVVWFVVPLVIVSNPAQSGILGIGLSVFDVSIVLFGFILGKLADTSNKRLLVFFGLLIFALASILVGIQFGWLFLLFGFIAAVGDEMATASLWAWLHALDTTHAHDGAISGVICFFSDFGYAIGPVLAGILYSLVGPTWTIGCGALCIFGTLIVFQVLHRGTPSTAMQHTVPHKPRRYPHKK